MQIRGGWAVDIDDFYNQAGIGPKDIDLMQAYDDYPIICFMQLEDLGFCDKGEAGRFVQSHDLTTGGVSCFGMINYDRGICTSAAIFSRSTA